MADIDRESPFCPGDIAIVFAIAILDGGKAIRYILGHWILAKKSRIHRLCLCNLFAR